LHAVEEGVLLEFLGAAKGTEAGLLIGD